MNERHCIGADGNALADGAEALAGLGFDTDLAGLEAEGSRNLLDHAGNVWSQLGLFEFHRGIDVNNLITGVIQELADVAEEDEARGVMPRGGGVGKVSADIAERGGAQQRVADGVDQGVGVGMAYGAFVERNLHAAKNELTARRETVEVIPNSNTVGIRNYEF
jgi:hypothetical protein